MNELQHACGALGQGGTEDVARCCGQSPVDAERHEVPDRLESRAKSKHMLRPQILRPKSMGYKACTLHSIAFPHVQHPRTLPDVTNSPLNFRRTTPSS